MRADIEVKEVIVSALQTRGKGIEGDPVRRVLQVFEKDGTLIAENDLNDTFTLFDMIHFCRWFCANTDLLPAAPKDVYKWLDNIKREKEKP